MRGGEGFLRPHVHEHTVIAEPLVDLDGAEAALAGRVMSDQRRASR
jgi:hypothetical protein